jgi:hypothetical protein
MQPIINWLMNVGRAGVRCRVMWEKEITLEEYEMLAGVYALSNPICPPSRTTSSRSDVQKD